MLNQKQIILGISAFYHDSAAAIIVGDQIIAAAEEERFSREKHTAEFPIYAIEFCLKQAEIQLEQVDQIIFYDKPFLKFERILEIVYQNVPYGFHLFQKAIPSWIKTKLNLRKTIQKELKQLAPDYKIQRDRIKFSSHHLSHAASAFYPSPFQEAAILIIDGVGEWATVSIGKGQGNKIELLEQINFPHSLGMLYSAFTEYLGFRVNNGEYKLMGLSPYGNWEAEQTKSFYAKIKNHLIQVLDDGSFELNLAYFRFNRKEKMTHNSKWEKLFGLKQRNKTAEFTQTHANFALAIQRVTEEIVVGLAKRAVEKTGCHHLVMAGGVALNGVANGKLIQKEFIKDLWVQPAASDAGGALGAAMLGAVMNEEKLDTREFKTSFRNAFIGDSVDVVEIQKQLKNMDYLVDTFADHKTMANHVADLVATGHLIGWVQGLFEFGPRALGGRSIIASPLKKSSQVRINRDVKFREDFRPFAPAMLREESIRLYDFVYSAPYMQFVTQIKPAFRIELPDDFNEKTIAERVKIPVATLEAVTHVDYSSRLQVIEDQDHPFFELLQALKEKTGYGVVLNTSFNMAGEPMVSSIKDIFECFEQTALDTLVVENIVIKKKN